MFDLLFLRLNLVAVQIHVLLEFMQFEIDVFQAELIPFLFKDFQDFAFLFLLFVLNYWVESLNLLLFKLLRLV